MVYLCTHLQTLLVAYLPNHKIDCNRHCTVNGVTLQLLALL